MARIPSLRLNPRHVFDQAFETVTDVVTNAIERGRSTIDPLVGEARKRLNVLDLATVSEVRVQTRRASRRVSDAVSDFLESQQGRDEALVDAFRTAVREELQVLAAAIDDDVFSPETNFDDARVRRYDIDLESLDDLGLDEDTDEDEDDLVY